jgi:PAS domain S-box-containing protein
VRATLRRASRSLRLKVTLALGALLAASGIGLMVAFVAILERSEQGQLLRTTDHHASLFADAFAQGLAENDRDLVHSTARAFWSDADVLYLIVRDKEGIVEQFTSRCPPRVFAEAPRPPDVKHLRGIQRTILSQGGVIDLILPLLPEGGKDGLEPAGLLQLGISLHAAKLEAAKTRWRAAAIVGVALILGLLGTMIVVDRIFGPIDALGQLTRRALDGHFDVWVRSKSEDEIGSLTDSILEMTAYVRESKAREETWNFELARRVEEKTREVDEARLQLENIIENIGASVLVADIDGSIALANNHTMQIFGTKPDWAIGMPLDDFTCDPSRKTASIVASLANGQSSVYEATRRVDAATEMNVVVTHALLRDVQGASSGVLQITQDVTSLKTIEKKLRQAERLSRMGEMAGEIGHELNNYLMAIGGRAELIPAHLSHGRHEKVQQSAAIIVEQVREMRKLTDGLLETARKDSAPERVDLNELVRGSLEFVRPQQRFGGVKFDVALANGPVTVFADPQQLRQVILNLLVNSSESISEHGAEGGKITLETFVEPQVAGFRIRDNGGGIEPAITSRIFEPRFTTKNRGHGFGLAVCHRVIENHKGTIDVSSAKGQGATFTIRLPRLVEVAAEARTPAPLPREDVSVRSS